MLRFNIEINKNYKILGGAVLGAIVLLLSACCLVITLLEPPTSESEQRSEKPIIEQSEVEAVNEEIPEDPKPEFEVINGVLSYNIDSLQDQELYRVTKVIDGDTIKVQTAEKIETIRLIGINAPENSNNSKDCYGSESTNYLKDSIENKAVYLLADDSQDNKDRYDRLLRYLILENGEVVNYSIIKEGYAYEYTYDKPYLFTDEFKSAKESAQEEEVGLFGEACRCASSSGRVSSECTAEPEVQGVEDNQVPEPTPSPLPAPKPAPPPKVIEEPKVSEEPEPEPEPSPGFVCDCSKTCGNMISCTEAYYQLNECGCNQRDGDSDGIPCESLCR